MDDEAVRAMGGQELIGHGKHGDTDVAAVVDVPVEIEVELVHLVRHMLERNTILRKPHFLVAFRHHFRQHRDFRGHTVGGFQLAGVGIHQVPAACAFGNQHTRVRIRHTVVGIDPQRRDLTYPNRHFDIIAPKRIDRKHFRAHLRDNPHLPLFDQVKCGQVQTPHITGETLLEIKQHRRRTQPVVFVHVLTRDSVSMGVGVHCDLRFTVCGLRFMN